MLYELGLLAINNLNRARTRLAMTAGGVLVGTTAVILLVALTAGLQLAAEASIGNNSQLTELEVYPNYGFGPPGGGGSETPEEIPTLSPSAVQALWNIPGVAAVIPITYLQSGEINAGRLTGYASIMGVDPRLLPYLGVNVQQGEFTLERGQMLLGPHVGDYFFDPKATNTESFQPERVDLYTTPFKIKLYQYSGPTPSERRIDGNPTGVLTENDRFGSSILMPIQDVLSYNEWITGNEYDPKTFVYDQVIVRATSRETVTSVSNAIREMGYMPSGMGEYINQLNGFFSAMRLILGGVGGIALLVAAFGVANTMTMAILERTKEIGLMKAIGATDRDVLTVFLVEAGLVGLTGGASGVALSYFLQNVVNQALAQAAANGDGQSGGIGSFLPFDTSRIGGQLFVIQPELAIFALVLATAVGLGAGLYPALRAARLPPVLALKSE
ncbi:MAG: ABC transporter permease [Anaerolineae bacterium]|nr:ABC transporter permease [Anaerolineae bacterium]